MSERTESPFVPGARVAISQRHSDDVQEGFVEKQYKTGRFTVRGSNQQWRPWRGSYDGGTWSATETGESWYRRSLKIWDPTTDKEISEQVAISNRRRRWVELRFRFEKVKLDDLTDVMLDAIDSALGSQS